MLEKIQLPFSEEIIKLTPKLKGNKVSILIGENGTRKSYLLRHVLEDGIDLISGGLSQDRNVFSKCPNKIIAISALPSDRFPSKSSYFEHVKPSKFDIDEYAYIGPRTARNIVSRNQSAKELISSIFLNLEQLKVKSTFVSEICKKVGISTSIFSQLRVHPALIGGKDNDKLAKILAIRNKDSLLDADATTKIEYILKGLERLESYIAHYKKLEKVSSYSAFFKVWVDLERGQVDYGEVDPSLLEFAFKYDLLRVSKISFSGVKSHEDLSTGQWATFSTLCAVALSAQDGSLILIDEPENGLHPLWQREYVRNILSAIDHVKNCHVVIATHSPLILSSLPVDNSDCIVLSNLHGEVSADVRISPSGWDSNSLLEGAFSLDSPRGPELTDLVNSALKIISKGTSKNKTELKKLASSLKMYRETLPESDILREVISTIIGIAK